jgi:adenylate kinase family enzyme
MRISIIGHPGSGKSTLARKISEKLFIPHIQLDRFWFEAGGITVEDGLASEEEHEAIRAQVRVKALAAIAGEAWVSDGFFSKLQPAIAERADTIVYLNISLMQRLWAHAKRIFKPGRHPELTLGHELRFFSEIIRRTLKKGPIMQKFVDEHRDKVVEFRSWKAADEYVSRLL